MEQYEIIQSKLSAIFKDHLNIEIPSPDTDLFAASLIDSLTFVDLLLDLEKGFGMQISIETLDMNVFRSFDSICHFVASHNGAKGKG